VTAIKENFKGQDGYFKNTQSFSRLRKRQLSFRLCSPPGGGTMPAQAFRWFFKYPSYPNFLLFITKF